LAEIVRALCAVTGRFCWPVVAAVAVKRLVRLDPWATKLDATCAVTTASVSSPVPMMKHAAIRPPAVTG
jgi:hypothetical protein